MDRICSSNNMGVVISNSNSNRIRAKITTIIHKSKQIVVSIKVIILILIIIIINRKNHTKKKSYQKNNVVEEKLDFTSKTEFQSNPNMVVYDAAEIQRKKEKEIEDERNRNAK